MGRARCLAPPPSSPHLVLPRQDVESTLLLGVRVLQEGHLGPERSAVAAGRLEVCLEALHTRVCSLRLAAPHAGVVLCRGSRQAQCFDFVLQALALALEGHEVG